MKKNKGEEPIQLIETDDGFKDLSQTPGKQVNN